MKICVVMVDVRTDGSRPVDCDIRLDGMTMILTLPKVDMEFVMLKEDIKKLLEEDE